MKLHELLAIESNLETQAAKVRSELAQTFEKKRHHFEEKRIVFTPNAEDTPPVVESQSDLQTTVAKEIAHLRPHVARAWDAAYRVAESNMTARADIVLEDGQVLVREVPATALLEMQKRLGELQALAQAIPTLDPAKGFRPDEQRGEHVYKAREVRKNRTSKQPRVIVKYEATKEHPAQTELYTTDVPVGLIEEQEWSGMMTPAEKATLLDRLEKLTRAVRSARSRANEAAVDTSKRIAEPLLNYIFG